MAATTCEIRDELLIQAKSILNNIRDTMERQHIVLYAEGVSPQFLNYDRELENLMGEKERAIGALRQHDEEHGCFPSDGRTRTL